MAVSVIHRLRGFPFEHLCQIRGDVRTHLHVHMLGLNILQVSWSSSELSPQSSSKSHIQRLGMQRRFLQVKSPVEWHTWQFSSFSSELSRQSSSPSHLTQFGMHRQLVSHDHNPTLHVRDSDYKISLGSQGFKAQMRKTTQNLVLSLTHTQRTETVRENEHDMSLVSVRKHKVSV